MEPAKAIRVCVRVCVCLCVYMHLNLHTMQCVCASMCVRTYIHLDACHVHICVHYNIIHNGLCV